ncbi:hypothetical protein KCP74_12185 [Salmonella enterica subsp. enterica]|nr:hypothetical protein KCP74_12185 [Salmonella enterica subsp. enterica]
MDATRIQSHLIRYRIPAEVTPARVAVFPPSPAFGGPGFITLCISAPRHSRVLAPM